MNPSAFLAAPFERVIFDGEFEPHELPFSETIGKRGRFITFESSFESTTADQAGLAEDLRFLQSLQLKYSSYGAMDLPVHPFICECLASGPLTGAAVLRELKVNDFRSDHIPSLEATEMEFPGYQAGTRNDEIHNDVTEQHIFPNSVQVDASEKEEENAVTYDRLKNYVVDHRLWYVLLHGKGEGEFDLDNLGMLRNYVILLAVGLSPNGKRLVGVITHQVCHNLCD